MIEGLVWEVEGVDRGDMQIPLPPYALSWVTLFIINNSAVARVGLANAGLVLEKAWPGDE
jgi:hypothetical protein